MDPKDIPLPIVSALALAIASLAFVYIRPKPHYPPGPKGLPLIGSLLDINQERPWITYGKWAREYGEFRLLNSRALCTKRPLQPVFGILAVSMRHWLVN